MTKVLLITSRADIGGGPEHIHQLLRHAPNTVSYHLACPDEPPYFARFQTSLAPNQIVKIPHRRFRLSAFINCLRLIRQHQIEVIHSHGFGGGIFGRLLGLIARRPVFHTCHGFNDHNAWKIAAERMLAKASKRIIAVSKGEAALLTQNKIGRADQRCHIPNGVICPEPRIAQSGALNILWMARCVEQKNPFLLCGIVNEIQAREVDFNLHIVGDGPLAPELHRRLKNPNVTFHGATTEPRKWMANANIFLSTSRFEGMPLAMLEAMSESLAIVASDVVGNRDVVLHGKTGFLFRSAQEAAAQLQTLSDPKTRNKMGRAGYHRCCTHHDAAQMAQRTANLYQSNVSEFTQCAAS